MKKEIDVSEREAYFVGGGIASLAGAAFLIRDGKMPAENIHILEKLDVLGGAMDGAGNPEDGYVIRGGRMYTQFADRPAYECMRDLFRSVPSLDDPEISVLEKTREFNKGMSTNAVTRLVGEDGERINAALYQLTDQHRLALTRLFLTPEPELGNKKIKDYFSESFFDTNFWYLWATVFAFQPWHSVAEMRRYMNRFMQEFERLHNLGGIDRTKYNQYDSQILPLQKWLQDKGVNFKTRCIVKDMDISTNKQSKTVETIYYTLAGDKKEINIDPTDLVFVTNGSMTDGSDLGSMTEAPQLNEKGASFELWKNIAEGNPEFGNPAKFSDHIEKTKWESFTVTLKNKELFDHIIEFTEEEPGNGLTTFVNSSWLMSTVVAEQPHFKNQPDDVKIFWGYGLYPEEKGDYVDKKMEDCTGEEILKELCYHLQCTDKLPSILEDVNCIPCMMPFITAHFMPRKIGDRPRVVPKTSNNLAFLGQYAELPNDVVFTVEYSIRSAQTAVYNLLALNKKVPPINEYQFDIRVLLSSLLHSYK
ncbi:oleate hydratase [Sporohalobacter salinus]|nr:oleate hydratase [Sporohalobacter salinus]